MTATSADTDMSLKKVWEALHGIGKNIQANSGYYSYNYKSVAVASQLTQRNKQFFSHLRV